MKVLIAILILVNGWNSTEAKQPLQPVIVDGNKLEWKSVSVPPHNLSIGIVRSFLTNDFLYISIENILSKSILNFGVQDNFTQVYLDVKTNSGVIYFHKPSLRVPFFDNILGITSAKKGNNIEIRSPLVIFGKGVLGKQLSLKVAKETAQLQPELLLQKTEWEVGGFPKVNVIIQQENKGELHIRLMEHEISPLSVIHSIVENDLQKAEEILYQIVESDQPKLKSWAYAVLVALAEKKGDGQQFRFSMKQAVLHMERNTSASQIQEKVRLQIKLKREPIGIIKSIGDLSVVNEQTQLAAGRLWTSIGNYDEAEKVFDQIIEEYPNTYQARRAGWYKNHIIERNKGDNLLFETYQLVAAERWADVAAIYAQARKDQPHFLHQLVTMLHRHDVLSPVFAEYLKTIK